MSVPEELIQCVQQTALTAQQAHDEKVVAAATVVLELLGDETALWDMRAALLASTEAPPAALIPLLQSGPGVHTALQSLAAAGNWIDFLAYASCAELPETGAE